MKSIFSLLAFLSLLYSGEAHGQQEICNTVNFQDVVGQWHMKLIGPQADSMAAQLKRIDRAMTALRDSLLLVPNDSSKRTSFQHEMEMYADAEDEMHKSAEQMKTMFVTFDRHGVVSGYSADMAGKWSLFKCRQLFVVSYNNHKKSDTMRICSPSKDVLRLTLPSLPNDALYFARDESGTTEGDKAKKIK